MIFSPLELAFIASILSAAVIMAHYDPLLQSVHPMAGVTPLLDCQAMGSGQWALGAKSLYSCIALAGVVGVAFTCFAAVPASTMMYSSSVCASLLLPNSPAVPFGLLLPSPAHKCEWRARMFGGSLDGVIFRQFRCSLCLCL